MPEASDLPESLPEDEFVKRFGGVGGVAYKRMLAEIEARVDALPVFRADLAPDIRRMK
jgi:surfactin synthase thioesterase subunit